MSSVGLCPQGSQPIAGSSTKAEETPDQSPGTLAPEGRLGAGDSRCLLRLALLGRLADSVLRVLQDGGVDSNWSIHTPVSDVSFEGTPVRARVHLRYSKTDASGAGADIILGSTGDPLCPVTALRNYHLVRPAGPGANLVKNIHVLSKIYLLGQYTVCVNSV